METYRSLRKLSSLRYGWAKSRYSPRGRWATRGQYGKMNIPQEASIAALPMGEE